MINKTVKHCFFLNYNDVIMMLAVHNMFMYYYERVKLIFRGLA